MPAAKPDTWTPERVLALPEDDRRYECIDGQLLVTPAPRPAHQRLLAELHLLIAPYVRRHELGEALPLAADLTLEPTALVQPDLFVIPASVRPPIRAWRDVTALLLAVEVLSPGTAARDRGIKRRFYQRVGVPEYWIVDLDARLVERWRPADERPEIIDGLLEWHPDPASEPLRIELPSLFGEVARWVEGPEV